MELFNRHQFALPMQLPFLLRLGTVTILGAVFSVLVPQIASAITVNFVSTLNGAQEVPPRATSATGFATGTLTGDFGSNNFVFTYEITFSDLTSELADAHIHAPAPPGANASIVHFLDNRPLGSTSGTIIGDWSFDDPTRPLTEERAQQLLDGLAYFNLHTVNFPGGEIRGQIVPVPEPLTLLGVGTALGFGAFFKRKIK